MSTSLLALLEVGVATGVVVEVGVVVDVAACVLEVGVVTGVVVAVGFVVGVSRGAGESWAHKLSAGGRGTHRRIYGNVAVSLQRDVGR